MEGHSRKNKQCVLYGAMFDIIAYKMPNCELGQIMNAMLGIWNL